MRALNLCPIVSQCPPVTERERDCIHLSFNVDRGGNKFYAHAAATATIAAAATNRIRHNSVFYAVRRRRTRVI